MAALKTTKSHSSHTLFCPSLSISHGSYHGRVLPCDKTLQNPLENLNPFPLPINGCKNPLTSTSSSVDPSQLKNKETRYFPPFIFHDRHFPTTYWCKNVSHMVKAAYTELLWSFSTHSYNVLYRCYIERQKKLEAPERIRNAQSCREYTSENSHYVSSSNYILA